MLQRRFNTTAASSGPISCTPNASCRASVRAHTSAEFLRPAPQDRRTPRRPPCLCLSRRPRTLPPPRRVRLVPAPRHRVICPQPRRHRQLVCDRSCARKLRLSCLLGSPEAGRANLRWLAAWAGRLGRAAPASLLLSQRQDTPARAQRIIERRVHRTQRARGRASLARSSARDPGMRDLHLSPA